MNPPNNSIIASARRRQRARSVDARGEYREAAGAAYSRLSGRTTVPLFILVPRATVRKLMDVAGIAEKWIMMVLRHWFASA